MTVILAFLAKRDPNLSAAIPSPLVVRSGGPGEIMSIFIAVLNAWLIHLKISKETLFKKINSGFTEPFPNKYILANQLAGI